MSLPACTVLIAAPEHLAAVQERTADLPGERLVFADTDAIRALEVITKRRPAIVALERLFAATPRGAALINRIKADRSLVGSEIRVVSHDSDHVRVSPRRAPADPTPAASGGPRLDQRGTRRAPRFDVAAAVATVDGHQAAIVNLSTVGAQVVSVGVLKPNQRIRIALADDQGQVRFNAEVAWASFEIPPKTGPRYRAGIAFLDADAGAVDAFCSRHKA
jgi:hypothetical protein